MISRIFLALAFSWMGACVGEERPVRRAEADRRLAPALPVVLEAVPTCDFEAVVTWVLAVESPNRYRVLELAQPTRLVVDVRHE